VGISFLLKTDGTVSFIPISLTYQMKSKFRYIPNKKENPQHFNLLAKMNFFMIQQSRIDVNRFIPHKNKRPNSHGNIPAWKKFKKDNHLAKVKYDLG